jgi:hypothetical protein
MSQESSLHSLQVDRFSVGAAEYFARGTMSTTGVRA